MKVNPRGGSTQRNRLERRRWVNGLTGADLSADLILRKATTNTGAYAAHDLKLPRLVTPLLARVPAGCPGAEPPYARGWRIVAPAARVQDTVGHADARAGVITEVRDTCVHLNAIRSSAACHHLALLALRLRRISRGRNDAICLLQGLNVRGTEIRGARSAVDCQDSGCFSELVGAAHRYLTDDIQFGKAW